MPLLRRARGDACGIPDETRDRRGGDRACRGGRTLGSRWPKNHDAYQLRPNPFRRRRGRVDGRHHAGSGAIPGTEPVAGGISGDGEPRTACATRRHQGFGGDSAGDLAGSGNM